MPLVLFHMREGMDTQTKQPFINIVRQFIQKAVIGKTPGHQPASLEVHGRIASILAAMEAATILEKQFEALKQHDYLEKLRDGELDTEHKQKKLLDAYAEELSVKRLEWSNSQVSVVAGASFHLYLRSKQVKMVAGLNRAISDYLTMVSRDIVIPQGELFATWA
ncbi:hypothetical protein PCC82_12340 [Agrobacterium deltaense]